MHSAPSLHSVHINEVQTDGIQCVLSFLPITNVNVAKVSKLFHRGFEHRKARSLKKWKDAKPETEGAPWHREVSRRSVWGYAQKYPRGTTPAHPDRPLRKPIKATPELLSKLKKERWLKYAKTSTAAIDL